MRAFCSTRRIVTPSAFNSRMMLKISSTINGASPIGWLVHEQNPGTSHQTSGNGEHLLLASRQGAGQLMPAFLQAREAPVHVRDIGGYLRRGGPPGVCTGMEILLDVACAETPDGSRAPARCPWTPALAAGSRVTSSSFRTTEPDLAARIPAMVNMVVVLPAPLGPSRHVISPSAASRLIPRSASMFP